MTPSSVVRGEKRRSVHARVPVSRVGISSTPWHREIKIHSRLLFAHWRMCVKESQRISNGADTRLNTHNTMSIFGEVDFHAVDGIIALSPKRLLFKIKNSRNTKRQIFYKFQLSTRCFFPFSSSIAFRKISLLLEDGVPTGIGIININYTLRNTALA